MGSDVRRSIQSTDLRIQNVVGCWRERVRRGGITLQELVTINDLQNTASVRSITEVHPIPEPDRSMQCCWYWLSRRAGLLPDHAIIADVMGMGGIGQIKDLHTTAAPALFLCMCDDIGNACVTLPPVLVGTREVSDHGAHQRRATRVCHIQNLVRLIANSTEQVGLCRIALW